MDSPLQSLPAVTCFVCEKAETCFVTILHLASVPKGYFLEYCHTNKKKMWKAASCSIEHTRYKMHHALKLPFVMDNPVCQLDTLEKMRAQARNSLPQVGLWACLWQHFINCQLT